MGGYGEGYLPYNPVHSMEESYGLGRVGLLLNSFFSERDGWVWGRISTL